MLTETECKSQVVVQKYIDDVLSGAIVACEYVKLAVKRHLQDLEDGQERGLYFDPEAAQLVIDFFGLLKHSKGKWAGEPFILEPWQMFIIWVLFGWKKDDGTRRFRVAYNEVARKNGKSTFAAGMGLYLLMMDDEPGAEVYSAATKMDQAKIIHHEAILMTRQSGYFGGRAGVHINNIHVDETNSKFEPLGADAKTLDGLNPSGATVDELHAHPDSSIWDVIRSAVGARRQPLMFAITTAGFSTQSFCYSQRDYAIKVLEGSIEDDSFFAIIFTLDYDQNGQILDDWKDESCWIKANPNLGVSVSIADMRDMCREAIESASKLNNFLCKKLNIWTTQKVKWVNVDKWQQCPCYHEGAVTAKEVLYKTFNCANNNNTLALQLAQSNIERFIKGKSCFGALDLSSNTDIAAWGRLFGLDNGYWLYLPKFYCPKENARKRQRDDKVPYETWGHQGFLTLTEGNVVDYDTIMADVWADCSSFDMQKIAFDRWNFEAVRQRLIKEGVPEDKMIAFGQGFASMSAPMKEVEKVILSGHLIHNYNPVLFWMAGNVAAKTDPAENIKPDKDKSRERIDGIVALIMALGLAITTEPARPSIYEDRGFIIL